MIWTASHHAKPLKCEEILQVAHNLQNRIRKKKQLVKIGLVVFVTRFCKKQEKGVDKNKREEKNAASTTWRKWQVPLASWTTPSDFFFLATTILFSFSMT